MNKRRYIPFVLIFHVLLVCSVTTIGESEELPDKIIRSEAFTQKYDSSVVKEFSKELEANTTFDGRCNYPTEAALIRGNYTLRAHCCSKLFHNFRKYWFYSSKKLGEFLVALKLWECQMFKEQCRERHYAFSEYTKLVYDRFCDPKKFESQCGVKLVPFMNDQMKVIIQGDISRGDGILNKSVAGSISLMPVGWSDTIHSEYLKSPLSRAEQEDPCVQAAMVNVQNFSVGRYFEVKQSDMVFCDVSWCAFTAETISTHQITNSDCMPESCKRRIYVMMVIAGLLGLLITLANLLVLIVFRMNRKLMNSQGIYKISLAAADLLVGMFVFPTVIETMRRSFQSPYKLKDLDYREYTFRILVINKRDEAFLGFAGFFTNLSIVVSLYSFMIASFDRLLVVYRPLEYNPFQARKVAKTSVALLWILGIIYSILPFCIIDIPYMTCASVLVCVSGGKSALILYAITAVVPLLLAWITNIATFCYARRNARVGTNVGFPRLAETSINLETRLAKTLSIMVAVFTLCLLPFAVVLISQFIIKGIHYTNPDTFSMETSRMILTLEAASALILMSNSLWNFFIYNVRSKGFRDSLVALLGKIGNSCCTRCHGRR